MTIRTTFLAATLALGAALPAAAVELKFASFTPPFHTVTAAVIDKLNDDVTRASGGDLTVKGYFGGELGAGPVEQYVRAVQGVADITWGLPGYTSSQFKKTMIVELPGVVPAGKCGCDALWDAMDEIRGEFPGTVPLAIWTSEPNVMIMRDKVVRTPDDLAGLKIRVAGAGMDGVFRWEEAEQAPGSNFSAGALDGLSVDAGDMLSDIHGTAEYRANLVKVMAKRAVAAA